MLFSTWSPASWPRMSLTSLNPSRSTTIKANASAVRRARCSACSIRSSRSARFGSPVSVSRSASDSAARVRPTSRSVNAVAAIDATAAMITISARRPPIETTASAPSATAVATPTAIAVARPRDVSRTVLELFTPPFTPPPATPLWPDPQVTSPYAGVPRPAPPERGRRLTRTSERPSASPAGSRRGGRNESRVTTRIRPLAAVVLVALVAACFVVFGLSVEAVVDSLGCAVLVAVTVTDLERRIVPNRIILPALVVALVVQTVLRPVRRVDRRRGRGGRVLSHRSAHLSRRARHGRRQARGLSRSVARKHRDRGALRRIDLRSHSRDRHPCDTGTAGSKGRDSVRAVPCRRRCIRALLGACGDRLVARLVRRPST